MSAFSMQPQAGLALAAALLAAPGEAAVAAERSRDHRTYTVTPELKNGALSGLRVKMRFTGDADGETVLRIPTGANPRDGDPLETFSDLQAVNATMTETARHLRTLTHVPGALVTVSYRLTQKSTIRANTVVQPRFFSTTGRHAFLRVDGREDFQFGFRWGAKPPGWSLASDLEHQGRSGDAERDLHQSTLIGGLDVVVRELKVGEGRFRIALPKDLGLDTDQFPDLVVRIAEAANAMWRDSAAEYLVTVTPVHAPGARVYAGFGMTDAYAMFLTPNPEPFNVKATVAHEYLHTWIAKRFGTGAPDWFLEGFTDYYTRLVNLQAGAFTPDEYVRSWNETLLNYAASPYATASNAVIAEKQEQNDYDAERINYSRGSMAAALFDYRIRRATGGRRTLGDVMRAVMKDFDNGDTAGHAGVRLVAKARSMAGVDLEPDIERHLRRGERLWLPADLFDGCAQVATAAIARYEAGYQPVPPGQPMTGVDPKSRAYAAGLRDGMIYVEREVGKPGDSRVEVVLRLKDGAQERLIRFFPAGAEQLKVQQVRLLPQPSGAASAACTSLLATGHPGPRR